MRHLFASSFLALTLAVVAAAQIVLDPIPARVIGHPSLTPPEQLVVTDLNPNFGAAGGMYSPAGVAVDTSGSAPILYVSDFYNNRIMAWKNATSSTLANLQAPDLIIGQPNSYTTLPAINGGLHYPTGLMTDASGNLYVVDSGNNRILRYPAPFAQSGNPVPDIVLGQPDKYTSSKGNQGGNVSAQTICLYIGCPRGNGPFFAALALDGSGNLFVADAGNSRVLRFSSGLLTSGALDPAADLVIGQPSFTVVNSPTGLEDKNILYTPAGLAFDTQGHLFVTDGLNRIVVYPPAVSTSTTGNGLACIRFAGIVNPPPSMATASTLNSPNGIVMINNGPAVLDSADNRLLIFDAFSSPDWTTTDPNLANPPPVAIAVMGQLSIGTMTAGTSLTNFSSTMPNAGDPQASFNNNGTNVATLSYPFAAAVGANGDLFVADTANNRVLVYPTAGQVDVATEVLGQSGFPYNSPNSIQGKEFYFGTGTSGDAGIAVDSSSGTPHLYVSDPGNNRVLGFADARLVGPGVKADLVIGEPDLMTSLCNAAGVTNPATETLPRQPTQSSLCYPTGLAVDPSSGDLYVADSSNGRVLRFPAPFAPANSSQQANLVLGQSGFTGIPNPQASASVMVSPYGLVFDPNRGLLVSDEAANRVLLFPITASTASGEAASTVFGQTDFFGTGSSTLNAPHHIAEDSIAELYVADTGHNQILIFDISPGTSTNTPIDSYTGLESPQAVWVNQNTVAGYHDDIWVGDYYYGISRFPVPNPLVTSNAPTLTMPAAEVAGPSVSCSRSLCGYPALAITQDSYGALYVADTSNRIAIHYPAVVGSNSGSYVCYMGCTPGTVTPPCFTETGANVSCGLAPGTYATLFPSTANPSFLAAAPADPDAPSLPLQTTLNGLEVLINGQPSPLSAVFQSQINFIVPYEAPSSGTTQVVLVDPSTSQILGSGTANMGIASPAFFTSSSGGTGQIAALNCNNYKVQCEDTVNGTANPVNQGAYIQLYLNGAGAGLSGTIPPDGAGASGQVNTSYTPVVYVGSSQATVAYSGLAPGIPGLWQINIQIPTNPGNLPGFYVQGAASQVYPVQIIYQGFATNYGQNNANPSVAATIVVNGGG